MAFSDRLGMASLIVAFFGIAAMYLWPDKKWIGWVCLVVAIISAVIWAGSELHLDGRKPVRSSLAVGLCAGVLIGLIYYAWVTSKPQPSEALKSPTDTTVAKPPEKPPTLSDLFKSDIPYLMKVTLEDTAF